MWGANVPARGAGKKPISRQREKEEGAAKTYPAHAVSEKCLLAEKKKCGVQTHPAHEMGVIAFLLLEKWQKDPAREASKKSKHCKGLALTVLIF